LLAYTKFTFKEFRVCVRAIFAFADGYKLGELINCDRNSRKTRESWRIGVTTISGATASEA
jgi:hypothetical protein